MRLGVRVARLEAKITPLFQQWVRIYRYEDQTQEQAIAAHEAKHGSIDDANVIMRVFINKPSLLPAKRN